MLPTSKTFAEALGLMIPITRVKSVAMPMSRIYTSNTILGSKNGSDMRPIGFCPSSFRQTLPNRQPSGHEHLTGLTMQTRHRAFVAALYCPYQHFRSAVVVFGHASVASRSFIQISDQLTKACGALPPSGKSRRCSATTTLLGIQHWQVRPS